MNGTLKTHSVLEMEEGRIYKTSLEFPLTKKRKCAKGDRDMLKGHGSQIKDHFLRKYGGECVSI